MSHLLLLLFLSGTAHGQQQTSTGNVFVPVAPCRIVDTRIPHGVFGLGAPPLTADSTRTIPIRQSPCGLPPEATAYSLNVTVVPHGPLAYLTIWPTVQPRPLVSTLNSFEGRVVANAAIAPAGLQGSVDVFASGSTDLIVDINGFFLPPYSAFFPPRFSMRCTGERPQVIVTPPGGVPTAITPCLMQFENRFEYAGFVPVQPCRIVDTRAAYPGPFLDATGAPSWFPGKPVPRFLGASAKTFPVPQSACQLPQAALAYSLNATVVPQSQLSYLTLWPTGQGQPLVSTLNSFDGRIVANAAIVPAGNEGSIDAFATNTTDLILDVNGYFGNTHGIPSFLFHPIAPCRVLDTRLLGAPLQGGSVLELSPSSAPCGIPSSARAFSLNVTVVPSGPLAYLTIFPAGQPQPQVSTLNAFQGQITANAAIVPTGTSGKVNIFTTGTTHVIVDGNGYFQ